MPFNDVLTTVLLLLWFIFREPDWEALLALRIHVMIILLAIMPQAWTFIADIIRLFGFNQTGHNMGFLKTGLRTANAIVTLGGSLGLEHAKASFESTHASYKEMHDEVVQIKTKIDGRLGELGDMLKTVKARLDLIKHILESNPLYLVERSRPELHASQYIVRFNEQYSSVLSVGFGGVVGGSMALGAWALVSAIGTASTGTAIGTLSGVAATNATLAWFGGGALAAGGAGMSGGMLVLGGIVAAPIIFFAAKGAWTKARAFQEQEALVEKEHEKLRALKPELEKQYSDIVAYTDQLIRCCNIWLAQMDKGLAILYPWGKISSFYRRLLHIIGIKWKKTEHLEAIDTMNKQTIQFLHFFQNENTYSVFNNECLTDK